MSLYQKYRPKKFSDIVGQENVKKSLQNALTLKVLSHAYLFSGPRGTGKTSLARIFAKTVNCTKLSKDGEACGKCESCRIIQDDKTFDVIEIDAASNRGIDEIRALREQVRLAPSQLHYKVYIIDEVHMLTKEASNALLKTLEEPPERVIFILATTEPQKILPTIISRCQHFVFNLLDNTQLTDAILDIAKKEGVNLEKEGATIIAKRGQGSMRDSISILESVLYRQDKEVTAAEVQKILGVVGPDAAGDFVDFIIKQDAKGLISFLNDLYYKGVNFLEFCKDLIEYFRSLTLVKVDLSLLTSFDLGLTDSQKQRIIDQSQGFKTENLKRYLSILMKLQSEIKMSPLRQLPIELFGLQAIKEAEQKI